MHLFSRRQIMLIGRNKTRRRRYDLLPGWKKRVPNPAEPETPVLSSAKGKYFSAPDSGTACSNAARAGA